MGSHWISEWYNWRTSKKNYKELGYKLVDHRLELYGIPVKSKK